MNPDEYTRSEAKSAMFEINLNIPHQDEAYVVIDWRRTTPEVWIFVGASEAAGMYSFSVCPWDEAESSDADSDEWNVTIKRVNGYAQLNTLSEDGWVALCDARRSKYVGHATFIL